MPARDVTLAGKPVRIDATARLFFNFWPADAEPEGKAPAVIAAHQPLPAAIAVDDRCVHWATDGEPLGPGRRSVHRAPR